MEKLITENLVRPSVSPAEYCLTVVSRGFKGAPCAAILKCSERRKWRDCILAVSLTRNTNSVLSFWVHGGELTMPFTVVLKVLKFQISFLQVKGVFNRMMTLNFSYDNFKIFFNISFSKAPFVIHFVFSGIFISGHPSNNWKAQTEQWNL